MTAGTTPAGDRNDAGPKRARVAELSRLVRATGHLDQEVREELARLLEELGTSLAQGTQTATAQTSTLLAAAESSVQLALHPKPDRTLLARSNERLYEAARSLQKPNAAVLEVVSRIATVLSEIGI